MSDADPKERFGLRVVPGGDRRRGSAVARPEQERRSADVPAPPTPLRSLGMLPGPGDIGDAPVPPAPGKTWSEADADAWLAARDLVGWRFALDRIERLLEGLGRPQDSAPAIHIVGTNGKSSTTRMVAALLQASGRRTGALLSPHLTHLRERIEVDGRAIDGEAHAAAVAEVARVAPLIDGPGDPVTQFEAHVAAAFAAFRAAEVDVLVIEAGLGGRLDATNVLGAGIVGLASVDLDHTELLGDSVAEITAEKVAVAGAGSTLVLGPGLAVDATIVARDHAARVGAQVVTADVPGIALHVGATYQQRNFGLALAIVRQWLGALDEGLVRETAKRFAMPARYERIGSAPTTILDGAHNPAGARALVEALVADGLAGGTAVAVVSVLRDKDARGIAAELATVADRFVVCDCGAPRGMEPQRLASDVRRGAPDAEVRIASTPQEALHQARQLAGEHGLVVACGTLQLAAALRPGPAAAGEREA